MAGTTSKGSCLLCGLELAKGAMGRHLRSCQGRGAGDEERLALVVEGRWAPGYWLHLEVKPKATLAQLDRFLRDTWLECCGHLSAFRIGDVSYESASDFHDDFGSEGETMKIAMGKVFRPGLAFEYVYDFGSSTDLRLRVLEPRRGDAAREPIRLAARNLAPRIACGACREAATSHCMGCGDAVCARCGASHGCEAEMLLPVVNSPRSGTCGYGG